MANDLTERGDESRFCRDQFDRALRRRLLNLIDDDLIEEHRSTFGKPRSDRLERVLTYFHSGGVKDKLAILAVTPFIAYRLIALSGRRDCGPAFVDDKVYATEEQAQHALFVLRVASLAGEESIQP